MIDQNTHKDISSLSASQLAKLIVMRKGLVFGYEYSHTNGEGEQIQVDETYLSAAPGELIDEIFDENDHDDAVNEARYGAVDVIGVVEWCHYSWSRNYEVEVKALILQDGRALAFCEMSGGGKHGDPDAYPWMEEAKFIKVAGMKERVIREYTFEEIPETQLAE